MNVGGYNDSMIQPTTHFEKRGVFEIDPTAITHQQQLQHFFKDFLEGEGSGALDFIPHHVERDVSKLEAAAARMALHSCQVVTAWEFVRAAGYINGVSIGDFIATVWPAYDVSRGAWFRAPLTREIRENFNVPIISAGVKWLDAEMTREDEEAMVRSGYCGNKDDIATYRELIHGKTAAEIIAERPAIVTINNTVGNNGPHAVLAWDTEENLLKYLSVDERDLPQQAGFCVTSLDILESEAARNGAVTIMG